MSASVSRRARVAHFCLLVLIAISVVWSAWRRIYEIIYFIIMTDPAGSASLILLVLHLLRLLHLVRLIRLTLPNL